jgi:hypothetical protein
MINAEIALLAWIPIVLVLFSLMPARRAVFYAILGGMLVLPEAALIKIPLLSYNKLAAISISVMLGVLLFDGARLSTFRFRWFDCLWLLMCLSPMATSLNNGLGPKDGVVEISSILMTWGIPYFIGRLYLTDLAAMQEAVVAVLFAGLIYAPLCLFEVQFSPQLHKYLYGYQQHAFAQTYRLGGYRPMVFMQHGLAVGLFMAAASLIGLWLWRCGTLRHVWGVPISWAVIFLLVTTILCKSTGGLILLCMGGLTLLACRQWKTAIPLLILIAVPPVYMTVRATGLFEGQVLVQIIKETINDERADSLDYRLTAENLLSKRAAEQPLLGWGGWKRSGAYDDAGDPAVTDGLWIITYGKRGIVGIVALWGAFLIGPLLLKKRYPAGTWDHPAVAPAVVAAVVVTIHMIDCLPNGMPDSIFYFLGGGLAGLLPLAATQTVARRRASAASPAARPVVVQHQTQ